MAYRISADGRSGAGRRCFDLVQYLVVFGKAADVVLVPDLRSVDAHVEHAATTFYQLRVDAELFLDRLRQTGGCRVVVSLYAVFDADVHSYSSMQLAHIRGSARCWPARILDISPIATRLSVGFAHAKCQRQAVATLHVHYVGEDCDRR